MNQIQLIKKLKKIIKMVEGDRFTQENLLSLIEEIEKKGIKQTKKE